MADLIDLTHALAGRHRQPHLAQGRRFQAQILRAGGKIDAILDTTPRINWLRAAAHLPDFLLSPYFSKGLKLLREVRAEVRVIRVDRLEAVGDDRLREVVFATTGGERRMPADLLLLHQGVVPNVNLANAAGVAHMASSPM